MCAFFFFNDTATTEIYTLSLHDALPISVGGNGVFRVALRAQVLLAGLVFGVIPMFAVLLPEQRSEEHTSELQSRSDLVCRLLLEKKKQATSMHDTLARQIVFNLETSHYS